MAAATGKIKGQFTEQKDSLLGAIVISSVGGIVAGVLVFLIGGFAWALGCGVSVFLLLAGVIAYILLSNRHGSPTEGNVDEEGYRHGRWIWKSRDDQLLREDNYVHGVKDGPQVRWHNNGNKHKEIPYHFGKLHGTWTVWYENGNKEEVDTYEDGRKRGQHIDWYKSGQKRKECHYHDDEVPHGDWVSWYENGKKHIESHFEYGTPVGTWTEWDSNGTILCQRRFVVGIQHGNGRRYFSEILEPKATQGNVVLLIVAAFLFALATYGQMQPFPLMFAFFVIIFIHELGHFVAAVLAGIPISHFVLGVGPRLFAFHFRRTAYEVRLLPFMGYVKAYELRRREFEQSCSGSAETAGSLTVDPSQPRESAIEFVSRPRRLAFFLAGVAFNLATVLVVGIVGWMHKHPDGKFMEAVLGAVDAIWALTPFIGNSKEYMSGFGILMATGITTGAIGLISLVVACFNLVPIPPLDGFHVVRVLIELVLRRETHERYLLPLKIAGACVVVVAITMVTVFLSGGIARAIKLGVQNWQKPPIVGPPGDAFLLNGLASISLNQEDREVPSSNDMRLLALTLNVEGRKTLLTEEYVVVSTRTGNEYSPSGVLFGKPSVKSVFTDAREAEQVELSHATGSKIIHAIAVDAMSDTNQVAAHSLADPYVTLLYQVSNEEDSFELRYDNVAYSLKLTQLTD